ncbi:hypothetical protein AGABI1DRAFT_116603, partial [Agaricus bisporus var. burnettii JB137-S8]
MLSSKLFSLLTFAAAAVARIPTGQFFITNIETEKVLQAGNGSSGPDAFIVVAKRNRRNNAQIWSHTKGSRILRNEASQLVLEVPRTNGAVEYGTKLQEGEPRDEANDDLTQLWDYDEDAQHLFTLADTNACLTAEGSAQYAIVDFCDTQDNDSQRWELVSVRD